MESIYIEIPIIVPTASWVGYLLAGQFIFLLSWVVFKKVKETIPVIG